MSHKKQLIIANLDKTDIVIQDEYKETFINYATRIPEDLYHSIVLIISHPFLKRNLDTYLRVASVRDSDDAIQLYELVNSDNFLALLKTLNEIPISHKKKLQLTLFRVFKESNIDNIALDIYKTIMEFVKNLLKPRTTNTSVVYLSSKNVKVTEDVDDLGIVSFNKLLENFHNFKFIPKSSASDSIILTAELLAEDANVIKVRDQLKPSTYFFKIFPVGNTLDTKNEPIKYNSEMLQFELSAYKELFKLVKYNITPNILCKLNVGYFDGFNRYFCNSPKLSHQTKILMVAYAKKINTTMGSILPWEKTGVIITHPGGSKLSDTDLFKNLTNLERKMIMFQILYTLYVFEAFEISHGDLHLGNIFIIDVPPTELCYVVQDTQYKFTTTKMVKIYDYDHTTITKTTNIQINTNKKITFDKMLNPDRKPGKWLNTSYAETNIFNKNLDICILILFGFQIFSKKSDDLEYMEDADPEFDNFIQNIMPGFDYRNHTSADKIINTYSNIFKDQAVLEEANKIFNVNISSIEEIQQYDIRPLLLNGTWLKYGEYIIHNKLGRIVKTAKNVDNNHLYIPDTVIIPKWQMLNHTYFNELTSMDTIDITSQLVYTIDGRIQEITEV